MTVDFQKTGFYCKTFQQCMRHILIEGGWMRLALMFWIGQQDPPTESSLNSFGNFLQGTLTVADVSLIQFISNKRQSCRLGMICLQLALVPCMFRSRRVNCLFLRIKVKIDIILTVRTQCIGKVLIFLWLFQILSDLFGYLYIVYWDVL